MTTSAPEAWMLVPSVGRGGGIERLSAAIAEALEPDYDVRTSALLAESDDGPTPWRKTAFVLSCLRLGWSQRRSPARLIIAMHPSLGPLALACAIFARVPAGGRFMVFHGWDIWGEGALKHLVWRRLKMNLVTVSAFSAGALARVGQASVVHPTTSAPMFSMLSAERSPVLTHPKIRLLSVFRLGDFAKKGGIELLAAVKLARETDPRLHLTIAGSGSPDPILTEACDAEDWLELRTDVPDADLAKLYLRSDIFLLTSRFSNNSRQPMGEGFGIVLIEAALAGCFVLATRSGGAMDAVVHGITGRLVPERDVEAIALEILTACSEPAATRRLAAAARDWGRDQFSPAAFAMRVRRALSTSTTEPAK